MTLVCGLHAGAPDKATIVADPPAFTPVPHNSVFPRMSLAPPKPLNQTPGCLWVSSRVAPLRRMPRFSSSFCLTWTVRTPTDFDSRILWALLSPRLEPRAGDFCSFTGTSAGMLFLPVLSHQAWGQGQPASRLHPS